MSEEKINILLVDDDVVIGPVVKDYLESKDFEVVLIQDSTRALDVIHEVHFDACILDVKMPGKSGFELAIEINERYPNLPFLFLTGESGKLQKIQGLTIGADDYILKPFNLEELCLRLNVVTRRSKAKNNNEDKPEKYTIGNYVFNPNSRTLLEKTNSMEQRLSAIESQLLQMFCEHKEGIVDREQALKKIWSDEYMLKTRSLNVYVGKLRTCLSNDKSIEILNVHGKGYQLVVK